MASNETTDPASSPDAEPERTQTEAARVGSDSGPDPGQGPTPDSGQGSTSDSGSGSGGEPPMEPTRGTKEPPPDPPIGTPPPRG